MEVTMYKTGMRIKQIRQANNLTQKEFAKRIYVSPSYVCKLESGKEEPTPKLVKLIALEFNVSTSYVLGYTEEPQNFRDDFFGRDGVKNGDFFSEVDNIIASIMETENISLKTDVGGVVQDIADIVKGYAKQGDEMYIALVLHELSYFLFNWCEHIRNIEGDLTESNINAHFIKMLSESQYSILEIRDMYIKRAEANEDTTK